MYSQINLSPVTNLWTQSDPEVIKIADINNDGLNDIILGLNRESLTIHSNDYSLLIYYQNSNGTLDAPVKYSFEDNYRDISSIDVGDLNQDGLNDILIGLQSPTNSNKYGIFYQNTNNTLDNIVSFPVDARLRCARIGDINNDGINDMVISLYNKFIIQKQISPGLFTQTVIPRPLPDNEMKIADINNDGKNDIVFLGSGYYKIYGYFQQNGSFASIPDLIIDLDHVHWDMAIDDLNNDGQNDIIVTRYQNSNSKINIFYQNNGQYSTPVSLNAYELPNTVEIADLNGDGKKEIITPHGGWNNLSVFSQNSNNTYGSYQLFPLPYASFYSFDGLSIGDINNDGKKDIVIANYNRGVDILYNTTTLGTKESEVSFVKIYPNPTSDKLFISNNNKYNIYIIHDTSGRLLDKGKIKENYINVEKLEVGSYYLTIYNEVENLKINFPFIKK